MSRQTRRVARWADDLLHERSPRRLRGGADDVSALRAAIGLRSASSGAGLPDPRFVESLRHRLARETQGEVGYSPRLTRRTLLAGGGAAVAGAAAGVVGERLVNTGTTDSLSQAELVPDGARWTPVAALDDVPPGSAVRFKTTALDGFVVNAAGGVEALSAICTHLGCLLRINQEARRFDCPCHRASFALDGSVLFHSLSQQVPPLPRMQSRVRDGQIEVLTV
jgi:nitrite reductase/ring-hydroxylating ferredoxin subunit